MKIGLLGLALLAAWRPISLSAEPAGATIDWERGLVIVKAIGTADRYAPSASVARVSSRSEAEARAEAALIAAAKDVPRAAGGAVGEDAATAAVRAGLVELATDMLPDGSVRITRGLPLAALEPPREVAPAWTGGAAASTAPTAIVVDARNLGLTPGVGIAVTDGSATTPMRAIHVARSPKDDDPRLGARPERAKASGYSAGVLTVPAGTPVDAGALLVVVSGT